MIQTVCSWIFSWYGWKFVNHLPPEIKSYVLVGAPHTSNWDFIPAMTVMKRTKINAKFVIKKEWLFFPLGIILRAIGAIGVDRKKIQTGQTKSSTDVMAHLFEEHKDLILMIAPEGTRSANHEWKSGFWHIAQKAHVPIVLAYADYAKKEAGLGKIIYPTEFERDMREIISFYKNVSACHPEKFKLDHRFI